MALRASLIRYADDSNGLQKAVGIIVGLIALAVSAINSFIVFRAPGGSLQTALFSPYSISIYFSGLIALLSGFWLSRTGKLLQVTLFLVTGMISALTSRSGDLTSGVFLIFALVLIYQYDLGKIVALVTVVFVVLPYPVALASAFKKLNSNYLLYTAETVFGVFCLIILYGFVFLRHEIRHRQDKALLETRVKERTAELEAALAERSVMLQEIHHRVRNNLQIIISMLSLEADAQGPGRAGGGVETSIQRIYAMALVHETLYGEDRLDGLDLVRYARDLLGSDHDREPPNIVIEAGGPVLANLDFAVPFGLFLNELIALIDGQEARTGRGPAIVIGMEAADGVVLSVQDGGSGIEDILAAEIRGPAKSGFVHILAQQLRGGIVPLPGGTGLGIRFPAPSRPS